MHLNKPTLSHIMRPVQRIMKYPLLIMEIKKSLEDGHPDLACLEEALAAASDLAVGANANMTQPKKSLGKIDISGPDTQTFQHVVNVSGLAGEADASEYPTPERAPEPVMSSPAARTEASVPQPMVLPALPPVGGRQKPPPPKGQRRIASTRETVAALPPAGAASIKVHSDAGGGGNELADLLLRRRKASEELQSTGGSLQSTATGTAPPPKPPGGAKSVLLPPGMRQAPTATSGSGRGGPPPAPASKPTECTSDGEVAKEPTTDTPCSSARRPPARAPPGRTPPSKPPMTRSLSSDGTPGSSQPVSGGTAAGAPKKPSPVGALKTPAFARISGNVAGTNQASSPPCSSASPGRLRSPFLENQGTFTVSKCHACRLGSLSSAGALFAVVHTQL